MAVEIGALNPINKSCYKSISIKEKYTTFFRQRQQSKTRLYYKVSLFGLLTTFFGVGLVMFWLSGAASGNYIVENLLYRNIILIFSSFIRVFGTCIFSIVPTDELDIMQIMTDSFRVRVVLSLITIVILLGFLYTQVYIFLTTGYNSSLIGLYDVIVGVVLFFFSTWWLFNLKRSNIRYDILSIKAHLTVASFSFSACLTEGFNYSNAPYQSPFIWLELIKAFVWGFSLIFSLALILRDHYNYSRNAGWGTKTLYNLAYVVWVAGCFDLLTNAVPYINTNPTQFSFFIIAAFADIFPILVIFYVGPEKCFTLMARYVSYF